MILCLHNCWMRYTMGTTRDSNSQRCIYLCVQTRNPCPLTVGSATKAGWQIDMGTCCLVVYSLAYDVSRFFTEYIIDYWSWWFSYTSFFFSLRKLHHLQFFNGLEMMWCQISSVRCVIKVIQVVKSVKTRFITFFKI